MNYKHGDARNGLVTPLFSVWRTMLARCENPKATFYHRYGGRGIKVCEQWHTYAPFKQWAEESGYESGLTIDRIDNNLGYTPDNCRFVDRKVQARNRSSSAFVTHNGTKATLAEWSERCGVSVATLWARIHRLGWPIERAMTARVRER